MLCRREKYLLPRLFTDSPVDISVFLESHAAAHVGSWLLAFWDDLWVQPT